MATRLGLLVDTSRTEAVMVATGRCFRTKGMAPQVPVRLQDYTFIGDFYLLAVTGCDMVLDVDWLKILGFIGRNFLLKIMEFSVHDTNYSLVGSSTSTALLSPMPRSVTPYANSSLHAIPRLASITAVDTSPSPPPASIQLLITAYHELFQPPTSLPLNRAIDHRIPLLPSTGPINIRLYRYGHAQMA